MLKWLVSISAILCVNCQCFAQTAWVQQQSGITSELRAVAFFDSLHGFAAGDSCVKTTDGGKNWTLVPEIKHCNDLIIDEHGILWFAVCDSLAYSLDSGKTFTKRQSPCVHRLASRGTLLSGSLGEFSIFNSNDSGKSWSQANVLYSPAGGGFNLHSIVYSSNFAGIVIGDWCRYTGSTPPHEWDLATFLSSEDSGKTWIPPSGALFPPGPNFPNQLLAAQSLDSLNFIVAGSSSYIARIVIFKSYGGYDIHDVFALKPFKNNDTTFEDVHFFNFNRGFVIGDYGTIFYTDNGGKAWSKIPSPDSTTLLRITFTDSARGWIVGANGVILHTNNGGWVGGTSEVKQTSTKISANSLSYDIDRDEWILRTQDNFTNNPRVSILSVLGVSLLENIACEKISDGEYSLPLSRMRLSNDFYIAKFHADNQIFTLPLFLR